MKDPRNTTRWRRLRVAILQADDICRRCHLPGADSVDHIIPVSKAPWLALEPTNCRPMHRRCNSKRGTRPDPRPVVSPSRPW